MLTSQKHVEIKIVYWHPTQYLHKKTNTRANAGSLLARRWLNSEPALRQLLLLAVSFWLGWEWDEISSNVAGMRGNGLRDLLSRSSTIHDRRRLNDWLNVRLHSNTIIIYSRFI